MELSGAIALVVSMFASRLFLERGYKALTADEKLRLLDGFSRTRAYSMIPLLVLIGVFVFLQSQTSLNANYLTIGYFSVLIAYIVVQNVLNQRKMRALQMPVGYRRNFTISQVISMIGAAWFFFSMFGISSNIR